MATYKGTLGDFERFGAPPSQRTKKRNKSAKDKQNITIINNVDGKETTFRSGRGGLSTELDDAHSDGRLVGKGLIEAVSKEKESKKRKRSFLGRVYDRTVPVLYDVAEGAIPIIGAALGNAAADLAFGTRNTPAEALTTKQVIGKTFATGLGGAAASELYSNTLGRNRPASAGAASKLIANLGGVAIGKKVSEGIPDLLENAHARSRQLLASGGNNFRAPSVVDTNGNEPFALSRPMEISDTRAESVRNSVPVPRVPENSLIDSFRAADVPMDAVPVDSNLIPAHVTDYNEKVLEAPRRNPTATALTQLHKNAKGAVLRPIKKVRVRAEIKAGNRQKNSPLFPLPPPVYREDSVAPPPPPAPLPAYTSPEADIRTVLPAKSGISRSDKRSIVSELKRDFRAQKRAEYASKARRSDAVLRAVTPPLPEMAPASEPYVPILRNSVPLDADVPASVFSAPPPAVKMERGYDTVSVSKDRQNPKDKKLSLVQREIQRINNQTKRQEGRKATLDLIRGKKQRASEIQSGNYFQNESKDDGPDFRMSDSAPWFMMDVNESKDDDL